MNKAFTLAEVLITLGIIGIVAAFTLPALICNTQGKELHSQLLKAYSIIQQSVTRMVYEEGLEINPNNYPANTFAPIFKKYIKQFGDCGKSGCLESDIPANNEDMHNRVSKYKTYNKKQYVTLEWFDEGQAILIDGMFIMINNSSNKSLGIVISVDINGINKKPNAWGHDLFSFMIDNDKVIPIGSNTIIPDEWTTTWASFDCNIGSTARNNGIGCTYRALTENDYFKNLPK